MSTKNTVKSSETVSEKTLVSNTEEVFQNLENKDTNNIIEDFDYSEFVEEGLAESSSFPFVRVSAPKGSDSETIELSNKHGFFISHEQAELANFIPTKDWRDVEMTWGKGEKQTKEKGYLTQKVRMLFLLEAPLEVQEEISGRGWQTVGLAYNKDGLSELGEKASDSSNKSFRSVARKLVLFLSDDNTPLSNIPFQITCRGGFQGTLYQTLKIFREQTNKAFKEGSQANGVKASGSLSQDQLARCVFSGELGYVIPEQSPFTAFTKISVPVVNKDNVGKIKEVPMTNYALRLEGVGIKNIILSPKSDMGFLVKELRETHQEFLKPKAQNLSQPMKFKGNFKPNSLKFESGEASLLITDGTTEFRTILPESLVDFADDTISEFIFDGILKGRYFYVETIRKMKSQSNESSIPKNEEKEGFAEDEEF